MTPKSLLISKPQKKTLLYGFFCVIFFGLSLKIVSGYEAWSDAGFYQGILVEIVGMFFDIILIVVVFETLRGNAEKDNKIDSLKAELRHYEEWDSEFASYKVSGIVRELYELNEKDISLDNLHLGRLSHILEGKGKKLVVEAIQENTNPFSLENSDLEGANLQNLIIHKINLKKAKLSGTNFSGSTLDNTTFQGADLAGAFFNNTNLQGANFKEADLRNVTFDQKTDLRSAIFDNNSNLKEALVPSLTWIDDLKKLNITGYDIIIKKFTVEKRINQNNKKEEFRIVHR